MTSSKGSTAAGVSHTHSIRLTAPSSSDAQKLENAELRYHMGLLNSTSTQEAKEASLAPIVSGCVLRHKSDSTESTSGISQYGLLAGLCHVLTSIDPKQELNLEDSGDPRLFFNVTSPSSTFICGSQGSGKSHTLSCMLENCLIPSKAGQLPRPLTGVLFHYDTFISDTGGSPCEAAFLSSNDAVTAVYSRFNIRVDPLQIDQKDLNTKRMQDLMAVSQEGGPMPLYMHTVKTILRDMRIQQQLTGTGFDYGEFLKRVMNSDLTSSQFGPLKQRLDTLQSFMPQGQANSYDKKGKKSLLSKGTDWEPQSGHLTIVDLSCPCISPDTACSLFNVCLEIFLEQNPAIGRVVALDEAHKYMNSSPEAYGFTNTLLSAVRLQRHLGARVIISTQEPTISTALLNLCSVTIAHRFTSPEWLRTLRSHLAAAAADAKNGPAPNPSDENSVENSSASLFDRIVRLDVGEALLFSPSAIVGASDRGDNQLALHRLGTECVTVKIRARLTLDGGKSILSH
ncbi:hypothetical protein MGYG_05053 [Nannizzia gypsea CBS 118893]|uniref:Zona occludens toxin N-terminal domain-containing protein n=1 Tax=Arthroderma gypseum (strain ATCC MYA-4604 / CBS 118893) TaxID=535722 RepID=E4UY87_ARTGP|nr:hypothetical protein MGYG_05053 [Nannizzia gypsea CBS 118893]EFR02050.1 hypothetical protein MGYG_05053 [Nannizzia gypsea CBS 118893]